MARMVGALAYAKPTIRSALARQAAFPTKPRVNTRQVFDLQQKKVSNW
jgi:hypothetical protein